MSTGYVSPESLWEVRLSVKPGLRTSETVDGYSFEVKEGETSVTHRFQTPAYDAVRQDRHDEEFADETIARQTKNAIYRLMLQRMVYQRVMHPISIDVAAAPTLLNREELISAGASLRRSAGRTTRIRFAVLDVGDSLSESSQFWTNGFQVTARGCGDDALRIAHWVERAAAESDPINSFVLTWIAFSGLYGKVNSITGKSARGEVSMIDIAIEYLVSESEAATIISNSQAPLDALESYTIVSRGGERWSEWLKANRARRASNVVILKSAAKCVYGIRNQVFHEAPETDDIRERTKTAKSLLTPLVMRCLKNFTTF